MPTRLVDLATDFRPRAVHSIRALPNIRGCGPHCCVSEPAALLRAGTDPIVICEMGDYRFRLDGRLTVSLILPAQKATAKYLRSGTSR
jgi:hypothetical protein